MRNARRARTVIKPQVIDVRERFVSQDTVDILHELTKLAEQGKITGIAFVATGLKGEVINNFRGRVVNAPEAVIGHLMRLVNDLCFVADKRWLPMNGINQTLF